MKTPHLVPALAATFILVALLAGGTAYAQSMEQRYIHALAPRHAPISIQGSALQRVAFRQPDLLPVYGSSEALSESSPYQASQFFSHYPTGFTTFEIARGGAAFISQAEALAAIGSGLRGKKVIISFTPSQFQGKMMGASAYSALFSRLHATELAFSTDLSFADKQAMARRMLSYTDTLTEPVLSFGLQNLASDSPINHALYYASLPLGKLETLILELQDHWATLAYIAPQRNLSPGVLHQPAAIDWAALLAKAKQEQIDRADNNPYGFDDSVWLSRFHGQLAIKASDSNDKSYIASFQNSLEWTDLGNLLRILKDQGARPLLLGRPIPAQYFDAIGVSEAARQAFYTRLQQVANRWGVPLVDFHQLEHDNYFGVDPAPHTSREGWIYVDQTLDAFYHGTLQQAAEQK